ncbi:MAG: SDR family oxidoreductase [Anaerolineales bacterium]|nr:SDR family oxidoreductase [Anaerolineales bacterium]
MKVLIFGSTGSIGRQLVEQALAQGHTVTAFARNPAKLDIKHPKLKVVQGDVLDYTSVERAVPGHEAVLSALGTPALTKNTVRSEGTRNIIQAMEKAGMRRLICLSSIGIGDSRDMLPFHYKYILVPFLLRQGFAEHELEEEWVKQSQTDWTIVRPGAFTNDGRAGTYQHGGTVNGQTIKAKISRADVADFMLKQLGDRTYLHQTPWVSY